MNNRIIKNVVIAASIIGFIILALFVTTNVFLKKSVQYQFNDIISYDISLENAEIKMIVEKGNENKTIIGISASGANNIQDVSVGEQNGVLNIEQHPKGNFIPNIGGSVKVEVILIFSDKDDIDRFLLATKSGAIKVQGIKSEQIEISSHSGKISLIDIISNELSVSSKSGEIQAENIIAKEFNNSSESGQCTVYFSSDISQLNATSKSTSGDVTYMFQNDIGLNLSWKARNVKSEIESDDDSTNTLYFESESGTVKIMRTKS